MKEVPAEISEFLNTNSELAGSALETAVREWVDTNCNWDVFERSVRAGFVYPGADNEILCPPSVVDLGDDLVIKKKKRRDSSAGTWIVGSVHGHNFNALVFPEHAESADYELGKSKISKLWIQRISDRTTTFHWDRGADQNATDATTQAIVDFLCAGLAEYTYAE